MRTSIAVEHCFQEGLTYQAEVWPGEHPTCWSEFQMDGHPPRLRLTMGTGKESYAELLRDLNEAGRSLTEDPATPALGRCTLKIRLGEPLLGHPLQVRSERVIVFKGATPEDPTFDNAAVVDIIRAFLKKLAHCRADWRTPGEIEHRQGVIQASWPDKATWP